MIALDLLRHFCQDRMHSIILASTLCLGAGCGIAILTFFFGSPHALVSEARFKAAWISAMVGIGINISVLLVEASTGADVNPSHLRCAIFLLSGSVIAISPAMLTLTVGLGVLRWLLDFKDNSSRPNRVKERLRG